MGLNEWLRDRSLLENAVLGALVVGIVTFALNYSSGPAAAVVAAAIAAPIVGGAYYLGMRTRRAVEG